MKLLPILLLTFVLSLGVACSSDAEPPFDDAVATGVAKSFEDVVATRVAEKIFEDTVATRVAEKIFEDAVATRVAEKNVEATAVIPAVVPTISALSSISPSPEPENLVFQRDGRLFNEIYGYSIKQSDSLPSLDTENPAAITLFNKPDSQYFEIEAIVTELKLQEFAAEFAKRPFEQITVYGKLISSRNRVLTTESKALYMIHEGLGSSREEDEYHVILTKHEGVVFVLSWYTSQLDFVEAELLVDSFRFESRQTALPTPIPPASIPINPFENPSMGYTLSVPASWEFSSNGKTDTWCPISCDDEMLQWMFSLSVMDITDYINTLFPDVTINNFTSTVTSFSEAIDKGFMESNYPDVSLEVKVGNTLTCNGDGGVIRILKDPESTYTHWNLWIWKEFRVLTLRAEGVGEYWFLFNQDLTRAVETFCFTPPAF